MAPFLTDTGDAARFDSTQLGITHPGRIYANYSPAALTELAVQRGEATLTDLGALAAFTGARTGRSPRDKYTVKEGSAIERVDWTANQPLDPAAFARIRDLIRAYLQSRELFIFDGY